MKNPIAQYTRWLHTQWPAGKTEKEPAIYEDGTTNVPGVRVVGDLTGVPLLKFSADTGAKAIHGLLKDSDFRKGRLGDDGYDVAIIGAGVSGISAAIEARKAGLKTVVLESQEAFTTIKNFPAKKPIYTYPAGMEPAGEMRFLADVKEDLLVELREQQEAHNIEPEHGEVDHIEEVKGGLKVVFQKDHREPVLAQRVVVAIGRTGNFRKLNVPGENLEFVSVRLIDAAEFTGKRILVVGGGDSALEAAISLAESGADVVLSYRREAFQRPKPDNIERLTQLADEGRIDLRMATQVQEINEDHSVTLCGADGCDREENFDNVFILIGREPPLDFFRRSKIGVRGDWDLKKWALLIGFFGLMVFLYHWKAYKPFLGIPNTNLWVIFQNHNWFPFNLPILGGENGLIQTTLRSAANDPGWSFAFAYTAVIAIFGIKRIRRRKTPYITRQTLTLMAFQIVPLFLLPYVIFPYLGANGAFTSGGFGEWFGMTFLSNGPGTEPTAYWRAFGFILAWPLFIYNVFTEAPLWGWLVVSLIQTFVIIPLIIWRWGKGAYCGWICSCGAMAETLGDKHRDKMPHGPFWNRLNMVGQGILAIAFILLILRIIAWTMPGSAFGQTVNGFVDKNDFLSYKVLIDLWLAGAIGYGLYFHFSGRVWCRFACPLAALMHIYHRFSRFRIFADKKKCISCNACTTNCHQGIDIMNFANKGLPMEDPECVRCSACVYVCPTGTLYFGHYGKGNEPKLDRLWASPLQRDEAAHEGTPVDTYMKREAERLKKQGVGGKKAVQPVGS
ncbi:MAG: NAD(P)-binding domain-containing protein [Opitutales bacterium]